jgi:hypothetical protein
MGDIMKLNSKLNGELITFLFFHEHIGNEKVINRGHCMKWAYAAFYLYRGVKLFSNQQHAFIKKDGLYYDSECPNGVKRWEDLHCNRHFLKVGLADDEELLTRAQTLQQFEEYWAEDVECYCWESLKKRARNFLKIRIFD